MASQELIIVLDYGSQTAQLIARRVREIGVYSELFSWNTPAERVMGLNPKGFILSGGPNSVYDEGAPTLPDYVIESGLPILGICYGMQVMAHRLGGKVAPSQEREYGSARVEFDEVDKATTLLSGLPSSMGVWMSHGDRIEETPPGFAPIAHSDHSPIAAMGDSSRDYYGLQFHPEVTHSPQGIDLLRNFVIGTCGCNQNWNPDVFIDRAVQQIREQVGEGRVLLGLSGGVDSSVMAALLDKAIGDQLVCVFIDHGMLRLNEATQVVNTFNRNLELRLVAVDASEAFLGTLAGITDPEQKRIKIGELFVRTFEAEADKIEKSMGKIGFLAQGTIYPDIIESAAADRPNAHRIKSHHNVAGLPDDMDFDLVEPLRYLFKDEVRKVGEALGLPEEIVWRQPFPGPGLAIRCLGEITKARLDRLRLADAIFIDALREADLLKGATSQAFAVLLPVKSVGVMGDQRTYAETVVLRAVTTDDFMTADWARLPYDLLAAVSTEIINKVSGVNRVVYDMTSKPPATIEWE